MKPVTRYCKHCGATYRGHKSRVYCSKECRNAAPRSPWNAGKTGLPAYHPRNGDTKTCETCGSHFYVPLNRMSAKYCCHPCRIKARWGDSHVETRPCVICDAVFTVYTSDKRVTCGKAACKRERKSRLRRGELSEFWRGGKTAPYNGEWRSVRQRVYERDGFACAICGSTDRIQCHHIIPYRFSRSHAIENLVTLCRRCHSREELKVNDAAVSALAAGRVARLQQIARERSSR